MAQSFLYIFSLYQKDCGNKKKKIDICFISGTDLTHFVVSLSLSLPLGLYRSLTRPSFLLVFRSLIRTFSHFLSTSLASFLSSAVVLSSQDMGSHTPLYAYKYICFKSSRWCNRQRFTDDVIFCSHIKNNAVYVLWGGANKWNSFTSVFTSSARYKNTAFIIIGLFLFLIFHVFSVSLTWFADFIAALLPAKKNH